MIKNTSIVLVLNIFLFSGMANAEKAEADAQEGTNGTISVPVKDTKDTSQIEESSAGAEKSDQKESTNLPADSTSEAAERDARREMIAKERAAREMEARARAARVEAAREMAARVSAARAEAAREMAARVRAARAEAAKEMAARVKAAREEAAIEMAARVSAAKEEAAREMAVRVKAAKETAAREMAARAKERAARERDYHERLDRYEAERKHFKEERGYYRAPY
jgi:hypothetical protein